MEFAKLASLGKVAGIGGIALGVVVLLLRPVIEQSTTLAEPLRGWLLVTIAIGAFGIGALGIIGWVMGNRPGAQIARTAGDNSEVHNIDRTKGSSGRQVGQTRGKRSPVTNERGR